MIRRAAIFDMDGTLLDSTWVWSRVDEEFQKILQIEVKEDYHEAVAHLTPTETALYTIAEYHLEQNPQALKEMWATTARDLYAKEVKLKAGAKAYLHFLKDNGVQLALATSCFRELCKAGLCANEVYDLFSYICIADEFGKNKQSADIYLHCATQLGACPKDCVVFEDISAPLASVQQAGMRFVGVKDAKQTAKTKEAMQKADVFIDDYHDKRIRELFFPSL